MDEFGIETREGSPPELGGSELGGWELMPSAHARSDEPEAKTSSTQDAEATDLRGATFAAGEYMYYYGCVTSSRGGKGSTKWGATFTEMGGAGHPDFKSGEC